MVYRAEDERQRQRIAELELELAEAQRKIARLESRPRPARSALVRLFGAPSELVAERAVPGVMDEAFAERAVDALAERYGAEGSVSRVGRRLVWSCAVKTRLLVFSLVERDGQVRVRASERLSGLMGGVYGGVGGGVGGGLSMLPVVVARWTGFPIALALGIWLVSILLVARGIVRGLAERRAVELEVAIEDLVTALARRAPARVAAGARPTDEAPREAAAEIEAVAAAEAVPRRARVKP